VSILAFQRHAGRSGLKAFGTANAWFELMPKPISSMITGLLNGLYSPGSVADPALCEAVERRASRRFALKGTMFMVRIAGIPAAITLRDISMTGASGLMCEPVAEGTRLTLEFDLHHHIDAEVRWVGMMALGLEFLKPLEPSLLAAIVTKYGERADGPLVARGKSIR
jgi:hypothetical protein